MSRTGREQTRVGRGKKPWPRKENRNFAEDKTLQFCCNKSEIVLSMSLRCPCVARRRTQPSWRQPCSVVIFPSCADTNGQLHLLSITSIPTRTASIGAQSRENSPAARRLKKNNVFFIETEETTFGPVCGTSSSRESLKCHELRREIRRESRRRIKLMMLYYKRQRGCRGACLYRYGNREPSLRGSKRGTKWNAR